MTHTTSRRPLIGIYIGVAAAIVALIQLSHSLAQNAKDLHWKQAGLAREMVNKMLDDEGWDAMLMLDWEDRGREFEIKEGQKEVIKASDVYKALELEKKDFTDKDVFIRDRFDRIFFLVGQLRSAVRSHLVKLEDVRFPLTWYTVNRMCQRKQLFETYMKEFSPSEALEFFRSLEEWNNCQFCPICNSRKGTENPPAVR
jgi:hypothetical protein